MQVCKSKTNYNEHSSEEVNKKDPHQLVISKYQSSPQLFPITEEKIQLRFEKSQTEFKLIRSEAAEISILQ